MSDEIIDDGPAQVSVAAMPDSHARVVASPASVRPYRDADRDSWNAFVGAQPEGTFFHLAEWRVVLREAFKHVPHYLVAHRDGLVTGVLPLAEVRSWLFGHALVSTPFCV